MDGLKLEKWKKDFEARIQPVTIQFASFFERKRLQDHFSVSIDTVSQNLKLEILDNDLPKDIHERVIKAFYETKPEDQV